MTTKVDVVYDNKTELWRYVCKAPNCRATAIYETREQARHFALAHASIKCAEHV